MKRYHVRTFAKIIQTHYDENDNPFDTEVRFDAEYHIESEPELQKMLALNDQSKKDFFFDISDNFRFIIQNTNEFEFNELIDDIREVKTVIISEIEI